MVSINAKAYVDFAGNQFIAKVAGTTNISATI